MVKDNTFNPDGVISEWNEAMFKMRRLDKLQTLINLCKLNPLDKYSNNYWNYEIWLNAVDGLYGEGEAKFGTSEIEAIQQIKKVAYELLENNPPYKMVKYNKNGTISYKPELQIEDWKTFKKALEIFESKVKYYNDKHGLSTMNKENMDGYSILR